MSTCPLRPDAPGSDATFWRTGRRDEGCDRNVTALVAWRGFVWAKFAWYACLLVMCALMPIILSDLFVLIPLAVLFTFAAGPVHFLAAEKDSCRECGLSIERT